ncbi:MAG: tandem-95 repeat protein [Candidatus Magnetomorum sp.]|nr:tandem-95 repeat protein [Candidatus Magnetomorum sp.]
MNPILFFSLIFILTTNTHQAFCESPFSVTPSNYQHWGTITATVLDASNTVMGDDNDVLAVFVGNDCRGIASPQHPPAGTRFFLQVWSNTTGETLTFHYYDDSTQTVIQMQEQRIFEAQMVLGSILEPEMFHFEDQKQYGCMDPTAQNYNPLAEADDQSCAYAPVLSFIDTQIIDEDTPFIYTLSASDKNNDTLMYTAKAMQSSIPVLVHNQQLEVSPPLNWNGTINLLVTVSDGQYTDSCQFQLLVLPKNDPPVLSNIYNQNIYENTSTETIRFTVTDSDGDAIQVSVHSEKIDLIPESGILLTGDKNNWNLILTPIANAYGESMITVTVNDGTVHIHRSFLLKVSPVSVQPTLSNIPGVIIRENSSSDPIPFTVTDIVFGEENIHLTVTTTAPQLIPIEKILLGGTDQHRFLVITPNLDQSGSATITLLASNPKYTVNTVFTVIVKPRSEVAFFSRFQKLNAIADPLPDTATVSSGPLSNSITTFVMVRDQITGLIWEVKTIDQGIQGKDRTYTWYNSNSTTNGGTAGTATPSGNTQYFIDRLNRNTLGGRSDWRVPEISELITLLDVIHDNPTINTLFFPRTQAGCYWSTTTHAQSSGDAWLLNFNDATDDYRVKSTACYVRAVRGDVPCSLTEDRFVDNLDGTITDTCTGFMWSKNTSEKLLNHTAAKEYCNSQTIAEYTDWRLPTRKELTSLIDYHRFYPAIQSSLFDSYSSDWFWTNDQTPDTKNAWAIYFFYGASYIRALNKTYRVRPVRLGLQTMTDCFSVGMPMPGSEWSEGDILSIQWTSCTSVDTVNIRLSREGGRFDTFETLAENYSNSGQFDWTVAGPKTINAVITIEDASDPSIMIHQGLFKIQAQPVPIVSVFPLTLTVPAKGGAGKVTITNSGEGILEWQVNILDDWLIPNSNMSGINDGWFECVAEENTGPIRTGCFEIIAIGSQQQAQTICVSQEANIFIDQFKKVSAGQLTSTFESAWGCNWVDFDNDGWMDIYIVNRYTNDSLYHNEKNRTFVRVTGNALVDDSRDSTAATWGDFDNDGDMDVFVVHPNEGNALYVNAGNGTFIPLLDDIVVTDSGISYGASWVDVNNDGHLDLFVTRTGVEGNALYINQGNGHFLKNETARIASGNGQAVTWGDYLQNGWMDVMIPSQAGLYQNTGNLEFYRIDPLDLNLNSSERSFESATWADVDNDGYLDIYLTHASDNNLLLHNTRQGRFEKIITIDPTLDGGHAADAVWADFDRDGDLDLFVPRLDLTNVFYENTGANKFTRISSGDIIKGHGRACAVADYDNDGDMDLLTVQPNEQHLLFENQGSDTHWIGIECIGTKANRSAIGAMVSVSAFIYGKNVRQIRQISSQTGHNSQNSNILILGLGNQSVIDEIKVVWPGGETTRLNTLTANQYITITEEMPLELLLTASPAHHIVSALNGSVTSDIIAMNETGSLTWTAQTHTEWLSFIGQSTNVQTRELSVRFTKNPGNQRIGRITVQASDLHIPPVDIEIVQEANQPPLLMVPVQELDLSEDQARMEVQITIEDQDSLLSDMEFFVRADNTRLFAPENLSLEPHDITPNTTILAIEPNLNQFGESFVFVSLSDGIHRLTDSILVRVASINDPPTFSGLKQQTIEEDQPMVLNFSVTDVEQDTISIQVLSLTPDIIADDSLHIQKADIGYRLSAYPLANVFGTAQLKIIASDGPATIEGIVVIDILPINDRPTITPIPDQSLKENSVSIPFSISDVETLANDLNIQVVSHAPELIPLDQIQITGSDHHKTLIVFSPGDLFGIAPMSVSVSDGQLLQTIHFNVVVRSAGDTPMIASIVDQFINEDEPLYLTLTVGGVASESITVAGSSSNTQVVSDNMIIIQGMGGKRYLTINPIPNAFGQTRIVLQVSDGIQTISEDFFLTVQPINDPPVISSINDLVINEDMPIKNIVFTANDIDSGKLSVKVLSSNPLIIPPENIELTHTETDWVLTPHTLPNAFGVCILSVLVSDGPATSTETFSVDVRPVNDSPVIASIPDQTIDEDMVCTIQLSLSDEETAITELGLSVQSDNPFLLNPDGMTIGTGMPLTLSLMPIHNTFGKATVTLTVDDGSGMPNAKTQKKFVLWVNPINDPPEISTITAKTIPENFSITLVFSINDVEISVDQLISRATSANQTLIPDRQLQITGDGALRMLKITPRPNFSGETTVSISVFDGENTSVQTFSVTVSPMNQAPSFVVGMDQYIWEDAPPQKLSPWATQISPGPLNESNQTLNFQIIGNTHPEYFQQPPVITAKGELYYTLAADANGVAEITLILLDDGETNNASAPQSFFVNISPVNDPPVFSKGPDIVVQEDAGLQRYEYWAKFIRPGPDNESNQRLTFKLKTYSSSLFENLPTVSEQGHLIFTPAPNAYGAARFWVYLEDTGDGFHTSDSETFSITIVAENDPPTIDPVNNAKMLEDHTLEIDLTIADVDTHISYLFVDVQAKNSGLFPKDAFVLSGTSYKRKLTITPSTDQSGVSAITVTVSDGMNVGSTTFTMTVLPVNDAPEIAPVAHQYIDEDSPFFSIPLNVYDAETPVEHLVLNAITGHPNLFPQDTDHIWIDTSGSTPMLWLKPAHNAWGTGSITLSANDPGDITAITELILWVTIQAVDDPPELTVESYLEMVEDQSAAFAVQILDIDTSIHSIYIEAQSSNTKIIPNDASYLNIIGTTYLKTLTLIPDAHANGELDITLTVRDAINIVSKTVHVVVQAVNDAPLAKNFDLNVIEDTPRLSSFQAIDMDNDPMTYTIVTQGKLGTLALTQDNDFVYTPFTNQHGIDHVTYQASDGLLVSGMGTIDIFITSVNDMPETQDMFIQVLEDTMMNGHLSVWDADNDMLVFSIVNAPLKGQVVITDDRSGAYFYRPMENAFGPDAFTYKVNDGTLDSLLTTVSIEITPVNDLPVVESHKLIIEEDASGSGCVTGTDVDNDSLIYSLIAHQGLGTFVLKADGCYFYTPVNNFNGGDVIIFKASDGQSDSNFGEIMITVTPVNDPPVAKAGDISVPEDHSIQWYLNASDIDLDSLIYTAVALPQKGQLTVSSSGVASYTPLHNFWGLDHFSFVAADAAAQSDMAWVTITITPVNDPPVAKSDAFDILEDRSVSGQVHGSDLENDALTFALSTPPKTGTLAIFSEETGHFSYTPQPDNVGIDGFCFTANDGVSNSEPACITITISPVNDPPVSRPSTYYLKENEMLSDYLRADDIDQDALTYQILVNANKGTAQITDTHTGEFIYTPDTNANGTDTLIFQVSDGLVNSTPTQITLVIQTVNDAPVVYDGMFTTPEDTDLIGQLNATDIDGDALTFQVVAQGSHGKVSISNPSTGSFMYFPDQDYFGMDQFLFQATDPEGAVSNNGRILISVQAINDIPTVENDSLIINEDQPAFSKLKASDTDGDALTFIIDQDGFKGHVELIDASSGTYVYTPLTDATGMDSFMFSVFDGKDRSEPAMIQIEIIDVNDRPTAINTTVSTMEDQAVQAFLKANDPENDPLTYKITRLPYKGKIIVLNAGQFTYTPDANENGSDTFTFTVNDGRKTSTPATVTLTIYAVNDPPLAKNLVFKATVYQSISQLFPVVDPDFQDTHTFYLIDLPGKGQLNKYSSQFTYLPLETGIDTFTYQVSDGYMNSNIGRVVFLIGTENQAFPFDPDINNDGTIDLADSVMGLEQLVNIDMRNEGLRLADIIFVLRIGIGVGPQ